MTLRLIDRGCVVGIGESHYGKRGSLSDIGGLRLAVNSIRAACDDAGLPVTAIDGFSSWGDDQSFPSVLAPALGVTTWNYGSTVWGGGGSGLPTAVANAVMAVDNGMCSYVVVVRSIVQGRTRLGESLLATSAAISARAPHASYSAPFGMVIPMAFYAMRARRHMAVYGTTEDDLAEVAIVQRDYASRNPLAVYRSPITAEDRHVSRAIADPLRLLDCCMESDGATALIVTTPERAADLRNPPIYVGCMSTRTAYRWGSPIWYTEDDGALASSGNAAAAQDLYALFGIGPSDLDVALFYDGATIGVLLALEDWQIVERGAAAGFVRNGETRINGSLPVNTHGGHLSECYMQGASHLVEAVRQLRGTSFNQVPNADVALYAAGMGYAPQGGILLHR